MATEDFTTNESQEQNQESDKVQDPGDIAFVTTALEDMQGLYNQTADGSEGLPELALVDEPRPTQPLVELKLAVIDNRYGLQHEKTEKDGKTYYNFYAQGENGERVLIAHGDDPFEIEKQLETEQHKRIAEIEKNYGVNISEKGEKAEFDGKDWELRSPTFSELVDLENALNKSQPDHLCRDGKILDINYVVEKNYPASFFIPDRNDPRIFLQPGQSGEHTLRHELAHNGQLTAGMLDEPGFWPWQKDVPIDEYAASQGFHQNDRGEWILKGKDEGEYYKRDFSEANKDKNVWLRVDQDGNPITDHSGNPILASNKEVRTRAAITPASDYFPDPYENGAEAAQNYRAGESERWRLLRESPELYAATKEYDQERIDKIFGTNQDGTSKYIRMPNGKVRENNEENRRIVGEFERSGPSMNNTGTTGDTDDEWRQQMIRYGDLQY
jgi:hypothetical protein